MADVLKDKVAIVTGAGRGIGRGIALAFGAEGAKVVVNDYGVNVDGTSPSQGPAKDVADEIKKAGGRAVPNFDTVATMQGGEAIIKTALDNFGKLDILVTPAGILRDRMVFNMTEEEWDAVIATHLKGTFTVSKFASILFRQQRSGRIITFSSESGLVGNSGQANYGGAKSGIAGFTKVISKDLGRYGVTVNCIAPRAATRMTVNPEMERARQLRQERGLPGAQPEGGMSFATQENLPEDIAPFIVYLASDAAANVNGQIFLVYGGSIALMSQPRLVKTIFKRGRWTLDELDHLLPETLCKDLPNPAPPQPVQPRSS